MLNDFVQNDKQENEIKLVKQSKEETEPVSSFSHNAVEKETDTVGFVAANFGKDSNPEDYYRKMIDENPNNHLYLKDYAQFLIQVKYVCFAFLCYSQLAIQRSKTNSKRHPFLKDYAHFLIIIAL